MERQSLHRDHEVTRDSNDTCSTKRGSPFAARTCWRVSDNGSVTCGRVRMDCSTCSPITIRVRFSESSRQNRSCRTTRLARGGSRPQRDDWWGFASCPSMRRPVIVFQAETSSAFCCNHHSMSGKSPRVSEYPSKRVEASANPARSGPAGCGEGRACPPLCAARRYSPTSGGRERARPWLLQLSVRKPSSVSASARPAAKAGHLSQRATIPAVGVSVSSQQPGAFESPGFKNKNELFAVLFASTCQS